MKGFKAALAVAAIAFSAHSAGASPYHQLNYDGKAGYASVFTGAAGSTKNYIAAAFKMSDPNAPAGGMGLGASFIAFCIDLAGGVGSDEYKINNAAPFDPARKLEPIQITNIGNLFQASYKSVDTTNNIQAAAFQLALWEAAYETDVGPMSLTGGARVGGSSNGTIATLAQSYLDNITNLWDGTEYFQVNFLDAKKLSRQDLVMATPVPVPAAGLLLVGGFGALAAMKRRKEKRAA